MNLLQFGGVVICCSLVVLLVRLALLCCSVQSCLLGFWLIDTSKTGTFPPPFDSFLSVAINSLSWPSFIAFHLLGFHFHSFPFTSFLELNVSPSKTTRYNKHDLHNWKQLKTYSNQTSNQLGQEMPPTRRWFSNANGMRMAALLAPHWARSPRVSPKRSPSRTSLLFFRSGFFYRLALMSLC